MQPTPTRSPTACLVTSEPTWVTIPAIKNYLFFSTLLASKDAKGAPSSFRTRLLANFMEGFESEIDRESGKNADLNDDVILQYAGTAYVGFIERWIRNGMPYPPKVMAKQVGVLLERSL